MAAVTLCDMPNVWDFPEGKAGRENLAEELARMNGNTQVTSPESIRSVRLEPRTLATASGLRYSSYAFTRVCKLLAPGLSKVVQNIAGDARPTDTSAEFFSRTSACNIFNEVAALRFGPLLSNYQMVVDAKARRIDGFLGPKTHYLEASSFMELVESIICDAADDVEFAGASLVGRRLFLRYLKSEDIATVDGPYRQGYAFCIDEAGDDAIRAYLLYQRMTDGSACLQAPSRFRQRQRRTGSRFTIKLRQLLVGVLRPDPLDIADSLAELADTMLFDEPDEMYLAQERRRWIQTLRMANVPAEIAEATVGSLFLPRTELGRAPHVSEILERTELDLFKSLIGYASGRSQRLRELLESVAFQVFLR